MKVAVIGGGIAGYHVLKHLLDDERSRKMKITIFDRKEYTGRGHAFQHDDNELLLNYPSNLISLKKNKEDDFYRWLKKHDLAGSENNEGEQEDTDGNIYFSRQLFGRYTAEYFSSLVDRHQVKVRDEYVHSIDRTERGISVNGRRFDSVFLACGQLPAADVYQLDGCDGYISWPYPLEKVTVEADKSYAVIGTGLSALDCIRYVHKHGAAVIAASRKGQLPAVRGRMQKFDFKYFTRETFRDIRSAHHDTIPLTELVDVFKQECSHQQVDVERWFKVGRSDVFRAIRHDLKHHAELGRLHALLYYMQQLGSDIWPYMTHSGRSEFLMRYEPLLKSNMNPMPEPTAEELLEWLSDGSVAVKSGLKSVEYQYRKFRLHYEDGTEDRVHYVINATGPAKHIADVEAGELLGSLLDHDIAVPCVYGGIQVVPHDNRLISPKYGVLDELMAVGPLTGGVNYGNNGVYELLLEARRVVKAFYSRI